MTRRNFFIAFLCVVLASCGVALAGSFSPTAKKTTTPTAIHGIFYYPWFPGAWKQQGMNPFTHFHPTLNYYNGGQVSVIDHHLNWISQAHQQVVIASWFPGAATATANIDTMLKELRKYPTLKLAIYYEISTSAGVPSVTKMKADMKTILTRWGSSPYFMRVNGKPVLFTYQPGGCGTVGQLEEASMGRFYLNPKVFVGFRNCKPQPDSWHQYGPAVNYSNQAPYSITISPGFWKANEKTPRLARNIKRFHADISKMESTTAQWKLVTTFNEWGEGTGVEPTRSYWRLYIDALGKGIKAPPVPVPPPTTKPTTTAHTTTAAPVPTTTVAHTTTAITTTPSTTTTQLPTTTTTPITTTTPVTTTTPTPVGNTVIVAAGDIACDPGSNSGAPSRCDQGGTANLIREINPAAVLTLGDTQYESNTLSAYQQVFDPTWGAATRATGSAFHPAIGNHEYLTSGATGYCSYFGAAANCGGSTATKAYYSYNLGGWHFIVLNSECSHVGGCSAGSPQETWLKNDLANNNFICTLAYWHEPAWSSGEHGNSPQMLTLWNDLVAAKVDVALAGHNHNYERFAQLGSASSMNDGDSPTAKTGGLREFVVGTGGKNHYGFGSAGSLDNEQVRDASTFGVLKLTLSATGYDWKFVNDPSSGSFTDSGSNTCN